MFHLTYYQWHEKNVHINVLVQPRASKNEIVGVYKNCLKIRLTAEPINNKGNEQLRKILSDYFGVPKSHVSIIYGKTATKKIVCVKNPKQNRPA